MNENRVDFMTTTAYRSVLKMRKFGYHAETTEHRLGKHMRKDLFKFADGLAFRAGEPPILFQAYHKKETEKHAHLNASVHVIKDWIMAGGIFEHHVWSFVTKHGRKYWSMERARR